jgi:DNA invertase Pin-like site-specific DNA recombinase
VAAVNGEDKISGVHRDRLAAVYLRQSSMAQVREHTESTARQYGLAAEAVRLGWARADVLVIDTDLGVSGRWGVARAGFTELVSRVCSGQVGAIFGLEISRLARSNAEVARLMEFASITETLLIDADGVYDPGDVNDRMLLGMKSTIGEVELHVMAQRLQASKRAAACRGELRTPLPVGFVHDDAGEVVIDPDAEVQAAIGDLFSSFAACGSAYGVVAAFTGRRFPLRAYGGAWAGQLRWGALTHARVLGVLKNPCYAGAYVHGRYTSRRRVDPDGRVHTGLVERPRSQWPVLINDHHQGYLSWAEYLANEARLAANRTNTGARPPREGSALCQGIIACGSCGKPMRTNYHSDARPAYECSSRADRLTTPTCRSVTASTVDDAVAARLLAALTPQEVALALAAADQVADRHHRVSRAAQLAVDRARYEADRAERSFHAVEPENRLVARSLESRWEARLVAVAEAEQALATANDTLPPLPTRAQLETLAADLPGLWQAATTSHKDRKRLLRTLIADITLLPETDHDKVRIGIRWHTGASEHLRVTRAVHPGTAKRSPTPAVEMVQRLGPATPTNELADILNAAGLTTGHGRPFDLKAVQWIRHAYNIPAPQAYADGEISVAHASDRLGCSAGVVYYWIETGQLDARRGSGNRLCITWNDHVEATCRTRITQSGHLNPAGRRGKPRARR